MKSPATHPGFETECFLETIDSPFSVHMTKDNAKVPKHDWKVEGFFDGRLFTCSTCMKAGKEWSQAEVEEMVDGKMYKAALSFTRLATTYEPELATVEKDKYSSLSSIEIQLEYGRLLRPTRKKIATVDLGAMTADEKKAKKTQDRKVVEDTLETAYDFYPVNGKPEDGSYYRFVFKYRPRFLLKLWRVIESSDSEDEEPPSKKQKKKQKASKTNGKRSKVIDLCDDDSDGEYDHTWAQRVRELDNEKRLLKAHLKLKEQGAHKAEGAIDLTSD
ncbi:hypothetical protein IAT38_000905 [Cryptococcus sp. DSM 104549]